MTTPVRTAPAASTATGPFDYEGLLAKMGAKDRLNIERHIAALEADRDPAHARNWKKLAATLMTLAPFAAKTNGQQTVQFFIADGKYRMQVFALQDLRDGIITIYCGDVLDEALKSGLLSGPKEADGEMNSYKVGKSSDTLKVDRLDGKSPNPLPFYKDMLGWNRRALRITFAATATGEQVQAIEKLCALSTRQWNKG